MSNDTNKHGAHVSRATPPDRWSHRRAEELNEAVHVALSVHAPALSQRKRDAVSSHVRQQMIDSHTSCNEPNSAPNRLTDPAQGFQGDVAEWMAKCFLASLYSDMTERGDRLLEEVLELLQAHGYHSARVPTLVNYVFGRPVGEPAQEVGGVMVTLAAYCSVAGLSMQADGQAELDRINQPEVMARIRAKQEAKNALHFDTPLPGSAAQLAQPVDLPYSLDADPAGIRASVCDVITGTLMVGAQGHTPPPAGHWAEPFWKAARADATALAVDLTAVRAALDAAEGLAVACASVDCYSREEVAASGRAMKQQFADARALIDSQAVRNGTQEIPS